MPYGYKVVDRKIVIDETKAETERIFPMVQYELEVVRLPGLALQRLVAE